MQRVHWAVLATAALLWAAASTYAAQAMMDLLAGPAAENYGWTFDNGREFPGATGKLSVDAAAKHNGKDSLRLDGDFTKGGNYVQAAGALPDKDIGELSFWLRAPDSDGLAVRIVDGSGQCHQINLKIQQTDDWQQVVFPLARFFAKRGTPDAVPIVAKYEFWGGANDGTWHGPGKTLVVLTGTPAFAIEHHNPGWEKYDEKALRQGVRNWIEKYGKVRPLIIDLGNEPPLNADRVGPNIAAYKAIYEEVKKIDPSIIVVASSMGPIEEYFKAGFQNYCDVVDFHAYEDWEGIAAVFKTYERLFAKYGGKKPIWSTELGLNSQGMVRQAVATTLIKKLTCFFASGGENVCWFDLLYPDGDAKLAGSSSEAHNIFDARYSRYRPKLDAVAYYNMVNGLCIKKFVAQKTYEGGASAFLFRDRDGRCLQVLWKDKGRADVLLPLPGVGKVTLIAIDGRRSELDAGGKGLTLTVTEDPVLLLYEGGGGQLPDRLGAPAAQVASVPDGVIKGGSATLTVALHGVTEQDVELVGPAFWTIQRTAATKDAAGADRATFTINVPETSNAREGDLRVRIKGGTGELHARVPVTGRVAVRLLPAPAVGGKPAGSIFLYVCAAAKGWSGTTKGELP
jgi:hypothetical protein